MATNNYLQKYEKKARALIDDKKIKEVIFSKNTYEVEVVHEKKSYWPFLQISNEGALKDAFCTCKQSEKEQGCLHLAAAYYFINAHHKPLHELFKEHLFYKLTDLAAKRYGYDTSILSKRGASYQIALDKKQKAFVLHARNQKGAKKLKELITKRVKETEETSLKFSNLSMEEISLYRQGKPSASLSYELSFWSDLAKWLFLLQNDEQKIKVTFSNEDPFPTEVSIQSPPIEVSFHIFKEDWQDLIPSLNTVDGNIKSHDFIENTIEKMVFDSQNKSLQIVHKVLPLEFSKEKEYPHIASCYFVKGDGFYCHSPDCIFEKDKIEANEIAYALDHYGERIAHHLQGASIHTTKHHVQYNLYFDPDENFHIESYLFELGDIKRENLFGSWLFIPQKGFFLLDNPDVQEQQIIPKTQMSLFIEKNRKWLGKFDAFQVHIGSLQMQLTYKFDGEFLCFDTTVSLSNKENTVIDLDEWLYIDNRGFYLKKSPLGTSMVYPGQCVGVDKISSFIDEHYDELEQILHFFTSEEPVKDMGLTISLDETQHIEVDPQILLNPSYHREDLIFLDHYVYIKSKGFHLLQSQLQLPRKFAKAQRIAKEEELYFLKFELGNLKKFALHIDPKLKNPRYIELFVRNISQETLRGRVTYLIDFVYRTDIGVVPMYEIWEALHKNKNYLFTEAGLIDLQPDRYSWLLQIKKRKIHRTKKWLRMNVIDWIRLIAFEKVVLPPGDSKENRRILRTVKKLESLEADREIKLESLKATLRPYQETGVQWLWNLTSHGLSCLLCDEMGLGKTHQAMALIASLSHYDEMKKNKYLIVCPTSVIYHWQELLKQFLPSVDVYVYHGFERDIDTFAAKHQILLTSYGILRLEKKKICLFSFELAVFDEMQMAKNIFSKTHHAMRQINARVRLGLTGTPIENYLHELKALFDIILPHYLPSDAVFKEFFVNPIEKEQDEQKKLMLQALIKPFILRRKKQEVLKELPEKMEEIAICDLSDEQKKLYNQVIEEYRQSMINPFTQNNSQVSYAHIFALLTKLKQVCDHPSLFYQDAKNWQKYSSGKWDLFVELLKEAHESGQKVVVFSQYLEMIAIIESYLKKQHIGYAMIKGATKDRAQQIKRFKEDPACQVFIGSLLAAGVGINLSSASVVIHYDRWWNPAKENQATDRVHRIGQTRGVQVFKLVTKDTIEERIHALIDRKKGLIEETLGKDDSEQIKTLTKEELLAALQTIPI